MEEVSVFFDRYAAQWDAFYTEGSEYRRAFDYINRQHQLLRLVDTFVPPQSHILEFGFGAGHTLVRLLERGHRLTGIDVSPGMVEAARNTLAQRGQAAHLLVGQVHDLVGTEGTEAVFDAVIGLGVMEYIDDQEATLACLYRLVKPGGLCLLSFPNAASPISRIERGLKRAAAWLLKDLTASARYRDVALRPSRLAHFRTAQEAMEQAGFILETTRFFSYGMRLSGLWVPPLFLVRRLEEPLAASSLKWLSRGYIVVGRRPNAP